MPVDPDVAIEFFDFVVERHAMYERRQAGLPQAEWTVDPVLATRKFTNVFRWLDPGSQFVITDLLPDADEVTALYRCAMYRYTNWPDTWRWLRDHFGHYPGPYDNQVEILEAMQHRRELGHQIFSGAYMILPQPGKIGDKIEHVVDLVNRITHRADEFITAPSQAQKHDALISHFGVGNFLGLQILTDYMYRFGTLDSENQFVVPGPGSLRGTALFAPGYTPGSVIRWAHKSLLSMPDCPILGGKQPSVMDVQNCFCEYSKYVKGPRKNLYTPAHPGPLPEPVIPTAYER